MNPFKRFFGKKATEASPDKSSLPAASREVLVQQEGDAPIAIDPQTITHAFVALTHQDIKRSDDATKVIARLNKHLQPRIWSIPFQVKFVTFAANAAENGYPEITAIPIALGNLGLASASSIVVSDMEVSFDGLKTQTKLYVGFAFRDENPRIILPNKDGFIPK